jgi:hypothetical protein
VIALVNRFVVAVIPEGLVTPKGKKRNFIIVYETIRKVSNIVKNLPYY